MVGVIKLSNCLFGGIAPSSSHHVVSLPFRKVQFGMPIHNTKAYAVYFNKDVISFISGLFRWRCPAAISRFVIAIIVNAIDGMLRRRPRSHVGVEVFKTFEPSLADVDAASPVYRKFLVLWIVAFIMQSRPSRVLGRFAHAVRQSVLVVGRVLCGGLLLKTTATRRVSALEIGCSHACGLAAIALAPPKSVPASWWRRGSANDFEPSVSVARQVQLWHMFFLLPTSKNHNTVWG